jgi:hypothetical protein
VGHTRGMAPQPTNRARRGTRHVLVRLVAVMLVVAGLGAQRSSAANDPAHSGLPVFESTSGDWVGPQVTGINYVGRAKQWVRLPPIYLGAWNRQAVEKADNSCRRFFPYRTSADYHATGFFLSDRGAPDPWGYVGPFTARTVAFGSIPVEVSIELRQPRDAEDLPIGLEIKQHTGEYCSGQSPYPEIDAPGTGADQVHWDPVMIEGQVEVGVTAVRVDGVDLDLAGTCRTSQPGDLTVTSRAWDSENPENLKPGVAPSPENLMTTPYLNIANGGLAFGTVDIASFAGCVTTAGDDVSKLLTATVSGADNPVTMRTNGLVQSCVTRADVCPPPLPDLPFPAAD